MANELLEKVEADWAAAAAPLEETEGRRRPMDPELRCMSAVLRMLDDLEPAARGRVVAYLASRYREAT